MQCSFTWKVCAFLNRTDRIFIKWTIIQCRPPRHGAGSADAGIIPA